MFEKNIPIDNELHAELKIDCAIKKISIKQCVEELIKKYLGIK